MNRRTGLGLAGATLALWGTGAWWQRRRSDTDGVWPRQWPALAVQSPDGQASTLAPVAPRTRVINLWARWCAPCRRELPSLQRLAERLATQGFEVLGLAVEDDLFALREYLASLRLGLPVWRLAATDTRQIDASGTLPQTWLVAPDGRVLGRWLGERDWDRVELQDQLLALARQGAPW